MAQTAWQRLFQTKARNLPGKDRWALTFDDRIVPNSPKRGWQQYISHTSARFDCRTCPRMWPSNRVMVIFHMHLENGQGKVKVRRLGQKCNKCLNAMEEPKISDENIEILMEHLVDQISFRFYDIDLERPQRAFVQEEVRNPHEPNNCEGCLLGICNGM